MILLIDHYDSFTFNLVQAFQGLHQEVECVPHDHLTITELYQKRPQAVVLGPGPGHPRDAHLALHLLEDHPIHLPILGVCLGHQVMGLSAGASVARSQHPKHGRSEQVHHRAAGLFDGLPSPASFIRYNSLTVSPQQLSPSWNITAWSEEGELMALEHASAPWFGVQMHPESAWSPYGVQILRNFLKRASSACSSMLLGAGECSSPVEHEATPRQKGV